MKVIIAGSRTVNKNDVINGISLCNWSNLITTVISGTARGADVFGEQWAEENNINILKYPAQWDIYGKKAGFIRNKVMADKSDGLIAIWDGKSNGTKNMINLSIDNGLRIFIYRADIKKYKNISESGIMIDRWEIAEHSINFIF